MTRNKQILVIGQTPPPYGGQALMMKVLLEGKYENVSLTHLDMRFSRNMDRMGHLELYKLWVLIKTILLAWKFRLFHKTNVLYYGPSGPNKLAMYRDMILLFFIRPLFNKTIFHTHAGGISQLYEGLSIFSKYLFRIAFFNPDILIKLTDFSHGDEKVLKAKNTFVVPNGIKDTFSSVANNSYQKNKDFKKEGYTYLLYVGALYKERGIEELIKTCLILKNKKIKFVLHLIGMFQFKDYEKEIENLIFSNGLKDNVLLIGEKRGLEKWKYFYMSDIFCFPSYVASESFGLVLIESMQYSNPIVAFDWNGISNVVENDSGILVKPKDVIAFAYNLELLINDKVLRIKMGDNGRELFDKKYTIEKFYHNINNVFKKI